MSSPERGIDYYRQFFIDPSRPIDQSFLDASTFLTTQLLGTPAETDLTFSGTTYDAFINELAERMRQSRHFDARSMGQLHPNGLGPAILAHESSTMRNNNTVAIQSSPAETEMEKEAVRWMIENIARYDNQARGAFTTGGTLSNLSALLAARERLTYHKKWDGRTPVSVLTTEMAHYSVNKAARILGPNGLITVNEIPTSANYKMDVQALKDQIRKMREANQPIMAIVAIAGHTETGLVDNLAEISEIAGEEGIYLHVDGAYGGPFVLSKRGELFKGMENGDSVTVDPHKYLYTPYPAGTLMFRNGEDQDFIKALNKGGDAYILGEVLGDHLGKGRIEGSMGGQGAAAALAVIRTLGTDGLKAVLDHNIDLTDLAYRRVVDQDSPFTPAFVPELNTLSFYPTVMEHRVDAWIEKAVGRLEQESGYYLATEILPINEGFENEGNEMVKSRVFRMVISHPYTTEEIIEGSVEDLTRIWSTIVREETGERI